MPGDSLRDLYVKPNQPVSARRENDLIRRVADLGGERASGRRASGAATQFPFEVYKTADLEVKVRAGNIFWQDQIISVPLSSAIAIPQSSTAHKVWLSFDNEFANPTPTVTVNSGASGWSGYPSQPNPTARRHWLLAEIASNSTVITTITKIWFGGDISWPPAFGFWA